MISISAASVISILPVPPMDIRIPSAVTAVSPALIPAFFSAAPASVLTPAATVILTALIAASLLFIQLPQLNALMPHLSLTVALSHLSSPPIVNGI